MPDMVTTNDVMELMGCLTVSERLIVVEETLREIREVIPAESKNDNDSVTESNSSAAKSTEAPPVDSDLGKNTSVNTKNPVSYKHPILSLAGMWTDEEAEEMKAIIADGDKIDYDGW